MRGAAARRAGVVVVGARIAGAAAAWSLAPYAADVLLLERSGPRAFWPQQASWDRVGNLLWHELGLAGTVAGCGAPKIRGHVFRTADIEVSYRYPDEDEHCYRMSVPREELDAALVDRALTHGNVRLLRGAKVLRVLTQGGRAVGVEYRHGGSTVEVCADLVVLADGRTSRTADTLDAAAYRQHLSPWSSFLYYCEGVDLPSDCAVYSRQTGTMSVLTPCGPAIWCASASVHQRLAEQTGLGPVALFHRSLERDPLLGPAVAGAKPTSPVGGVGKLRLRRRPMAGPGWCLLGDCGYFLDPLSALGTKAALTAVRLLRDRVAEVGTLRDDGLHEGLTTQRDALLEAFWQRTVGAVESFRVPPEQVARAARQAADPLAASAALREQMGLTLAGQQATAG
jgi:flavin-dependent dehydrogenase